MFEAIQAVADAPTPVKWAVAGAAVLVIEHVIALATPPYGLHVPFFFHLSFGALYAWLGVEVGNGQGWAAITLSALLATQLIGRIFVWRAEDRSYAMLVKALLATGAAITVAVLALLWIPDSARAYLIG
ncbi:hypothetical protein NCC78_19690 [Micromonospora phytophila]|uniref:hypothetical protein n=1 Tax=Micromonospora phytophila TaxID=709888 RepID=UPI00202EF613|nr:hypothetical protein [Micromonospora phytophila]MCM0676892.1 hypothetical protein [Micromonospora phytophila]